MIDTPSTLARGPSADFVELSKAYFAEPRKVRKVTPGSPRLSVPGKIYGLNHVPPSCLRVPGTFVLHQSNALTSLLSCFRLGQKFISAVKSWRNQS